jgi:nicotinate-nucleotide pyrophosphorylase (carboxylating)
VPLSISIADLQRIAAAALAEDGDVDITTEVTIVSGTQASGTLEYRTSGVVAGLAFAEAVATACSCTLEWQIQEGSIVTGWTAIGIIKGDLAQLLRAERPMLNFLQRASGIATTTRAFVEEVRGTRCRILHTRKTAPGLRPLDVAAVVAGGGYLHRSDLAHEVMVKDNHWRALATQGATLDHALSQARTRGVKALFVEVESIEQLELACAAGATRLLVDNQSPETVRAWARLARERAPGIEIEATGGISLDNVRAYAEAGSDYISVGALTHSVRAADIALEVQL